MFAYASPHSVNSNLKVTTYRMSALASALYLPAQTAERTAFSLKALSGKNLWALGSSDMYERLIIGTAEKVVL